MLLHISLSSVFVAAHYKPTFHFARKLACISEFRGREKEKEVEREVERTRERERALEYQCIQMNYE